MPRMMEDIENRFDKAIAQAHKKKMERLEQERVKQAQAQAAARAAIRANNSMLF